MMQCSHKNLILRKSDTKNKDNNFNNIYYIKKLLLYIYTNFFSLTGGMIFFNRKKGKTMHRVEIFSEYDINRLEKEINQYLANKDQRFDVVDIKYNSVICLKDDIIFYSAMIIEKENRPNRIE